MKGNNRFYDNAFCALAFLLLSRIISMCFIPLNDVSEARYAEIARKMLETGNWVTLLHDYNVPFWAKPPLSTWLSALSMKMFGVNEFAVRLPGLLLSIAVLWLIWDLAKKRSGKQIATLSILVLSGTLYFFLDAGTVMTDPSLIFCISLILVSFWHALVDGNKVWSYVFFIGLGLGLLAKGPIAVVLPALPIFFWVLLHNQWRNLWQKLPWIKGTLLMFAIALPWYIWAELRTPGFLNYFIVGEHFHRFVTPGWAGDKYGFAHKEHWGMIWVFAAIGIFPWSILGFTWFVRYRKFLPALFQDKDGWMAYLFLCTVVPLLFFSFSSNIIYTYVFPCLSFFALFFTEYWVRAGAMLPAEQLIVRLSALCGAIFLIGTLVFVFAPQLVAKTQKPVVASWVKKDPLAQSNLIYWNYKTEFSAQFYSFGKVKFAQDANSLCKILSKKGENYLAVRAQEKQQLPKNLLGHLTQIDEVMASGHSYLLMRCDALSC